MAVTTKKYTIERRVGNLFQKGQVVDLDIDTAVYYSSIGYIRLSNAEISDYLTKLNAEIDKSIDEEVSTGDVKPSYVPAQNLEEVKTDLLKEVSGSFVSTTDFNAAMQNLQDNLLASIKGEAAPTTPKTTTVI